MKCDGKFLSWKSFIVFLEDDFRIFFTIRNKWNKESIRDYSKLQRSDNVRTTETLRKLEDIVCLTNESIYYS